MNNYLDTSTKFNENTFDRQKLFNDIENIISKKYPIDDFKGNIYYIKEDGFSDIPDMFYVKCAFSWIFYEEDIKKSDFKKVALDIEKLLADSIINKINNILEINVIRYDNSRYSSTGYDVELTLNIEYLYN